MGCIGYVSHHKFLTSEVNEVQVFTDMPEGNPMEILPPGLDKKLQWYIFNEIG